MAYEVRVSDEPARTIVGVARHAAMSGLGETFMEGFGKVYAHLDAKNIGGRGHNVAYYTKVEPSGGEMSFDVVCGVQVEQDVATDGDVQMHETPTGPAATAVFHGDYSGLHEAHAAIHQWCEANGRSFGRNWEVYGDWEDDPSKRRTDVYYELTP